MLQPVYLPMEDVPPDHPGVQALLKKLGLAEIFAIPRLPLAPAGGCYWNVMAQVNRYQGALVTGWLVQWVPGIYINAMHHGVWRSPSGELLDISCTEVGPQVEGVSTFIPDSRDRLDLSDRVLIESHHIELLSDPDVTRALEQYRQHNRAHIAHREFLRAIGYKWDSRTGQYSGSLPIPKSLEHAFTEAIRTSFEAMHEARAKILARYFATDGGDAKPA